MNYRLQPDVVLTTICGESFLIASGEARGKVPYIEGVTRPGAYFWKLLESGLSVDAIISKAAADYNVPTETATAAFDKLTAALQKMGYISFSEETV